MVIFYLQRAARKKPQHSNRILKNLAGMVNGIAVLILMTALLLDQKKMKNAVLMLLHKAGLSYQAQVTMKERKWRWLLWINILYAEIFTSFNYSIHHLMRKVLIPVI